MFVFVLTDCLSTFVLTGCLFVVFVLTGSFPIVPDSLPVVMLSIFFEIDGLGDEVVVEDEEDVMASYLSENVVAGPTDLVTEPTLLLLSSRPLLGPSPRSLPAIPFVVPALFR